MPGAGFYSYVHKDDDAESGRIVDLSQRLVGEYGLLSGESLDLFVDRRSINWGDDWRSDIDSALQNGSYFLPVLTPRYFRSPECRRELTEFSRRASQLGAESFILPIVWVMFDELTNPDNRRSDRSCPEVSMV
ncbi:MAG: toll/interleukin-1 receptor domain-containing protein [Leifsonia sp.]